MRTMENKVGRKSQPKESKIMEPDIKVKITTNVTFEDQSINSMPKYENKSSFPRSSQHELN